MRHYLRILRPSRSSDRRAMARIMAAAENNEDGTALFHVLPRSVVGRWFK